MRAFVLTWQTREGLVATLLLCSAAEVTFATLTLPCIRPNLTLAKLQGLRMIRAKYPNGNMEESGNWLQGAGASMGGEGKHASHSHGSCTERLLCIAYPCDGPVHRVCLGAAFLQRCFLVHYTFVVCISNHVS